LIVAFFLELFIAAVAVTACCSRCRCLLQSLSPLAAVAATAVVPALWLFTLRSCHQLARLATRLLKLALILQPSRHWFIVAFLKKLIFALAVTACCKTFLPLPLPCPMVS